MESIYTATAPDGTEYEQEWNSSREQHQIRFSGKPSAEIRGRLKAAGFRWWKGGGFWYLRGYTYAGDDIPMLINGDANAGCHADAADHDERVYSGGRY